MPPTFGAVTGEIDIENSVGGSAERIEEFNAEWQMRWQDENSTVIFVEFQLFSAAQHAFAIDAKNSTLQYLATIGHCCTESCQRDLVARRHVERTTPYVQLIDTIGGDIHAVNFFSIRVTLCAQHLGNNYTL